ncbi:MAG: SusC/RagA family TonB-linked outer membrane protein, partial [Rikenellaceae bacterium]|nr:SusC/RagA family TonB-linked outer membrane protein [Rikenellaceae bacterium]
MRKFVLSICAVLMCGLAVAQNVRVSGTISDSDGHALIGASVEVKGNANLGTVALDGGEYTISVPSSATLIFSYMGMVPQEIAVGGRTKIDVVMVADAHQVQDVVVIGYGSGVAAESVVGSVSSVASQKLANTPVANVADVLQGKIPGMQVFTSSGEPTAGSQMFVRGVSSMNADTDPLYILDGTPVSASVFRNLNANDIESITLLKDAASTSIYGSRAANGVLYITTKKGRTGMEPVIKIQYQGGFSTMVENKNFELMNSAEQIQFEEMLYPHLLTDPAWLTKKEYILRNNFNFDWKSYAYSQNAGVTGIDASVTGATNNTTYYISAGYMDTEGIAPRSGNTRYSFRTNIDAKIRDWFKMGTNVNLTYADYQTSVTGWSVNSVDGLVYGQATYNAPYEMIFKEDGTIELGEELDYFDWAGFRNPYYYYEKFPTKNNRISLSGSVYEEISPIQGLTLRATQAIDASDTRGSSWRLPSYDGALGNGQRAESFSRYYQLTSSNTAEYKFDLGDNHFTFLAGHESIVGHSNGFGARISGITDDRLTMMSAGTASTAEITSHTMVDEVSNSFFGRVNYAYGNRYHIDASLRTDGSSVFGRNARWATFWSIGGMWNIKNEDFMLNADKVNDLRLRVSYGTTGNSGIGNYIAYGTIGTGPNYNGQAGTTIGNPANHDLTWETVTTANSGVTARLFSRASVEVDVYNRVTSNMLMDVPYSASTGYSSGYGNVGKLANTGFELQASYDLVQRPDMLWTVYGNVAFNHNEIIELYNGIQEFV